MNAVFGHYSEMLSFLAALLSPSGRVWEGDAPLPAFHAHEEGPWTELALSEKPLFIKKPVII